MPIDAALQAAIDAVLAAAQSEEAADETTLMNAQLALSTITTERDNLLAEKQTTIAALIAARDSLSARITALGG
jgi:hypothetical protein